MTGAPKLPLGVRETRPAGNMPQGAQASAWPCEASALGAQLPHQQEGALPRHYSPRAPSLHVCPLERKEREVVRPLHL